MNEKYRVDAESFDLTRQIIDRDEIVSEKHKSVFDGIKNNEDKYDIHTELVKSGNEGIFNDEGNLKFLLNKQKIVKNVFTSVMVNVQWLVIL